MIACQLRARRRNCILCYRAPLGRRCFTVLHFLRLEKRDAQLNFHVKTYPQDPNVCVWILVCMRLEGVSFVAANAPSILRSDEWFEIQLVSHHASRASAALGTLPPSVTLIIRSVLRTFFLSTYHPQPCRPVVSWSAHCV